jgi:hypothetical protein
LYLFEIDDTWDDLFKDLLEESEFKIHKTDTVSVTISDKLINGVGGANSCCQTV